MGGAADGAGGALAVLDRAGRETKRYELARGLATLGSALACDIRLMLAAAAPHHATLAVHAHQTVLRNVGGGETLVNGRPVSVAALRHGDVVGIAGRRLRWLYAHPHRHAHPHSPVAQLAAVGSVGRAGRAGRRVTSPGSSAPRPREVAVALELRHRATMPPATMPPATMPPAPALRQVAVVQPQLRDSAAASESGARRRSRAAAPTKATLWIQSRKTTPRRAHSAHAHSAHAAHRATPLRLAVLKRAQSARKPNVVKIRAPLEIDHTKQAAIMLMTGHTPKPRASPLNRPSEKKSLPPSHEPQEPSPAGEGGRAVREDTPAGEGGRAGREVAPAGGRGSFARRSTERNSHRRSVTILDITDSTRNSTIRGANASGKSSAKSPALPNPGKSALKDHSRRGSRKTESIKFDLGDLDTRREASSPSPDGSGRMTLRYSPSPRPSPRPSPLESYSVVDLVSLESDRSVYDSAACSDVTQFGTLGRSLSASLSTPETRYVSVGEAAGAVTPEPEGGRRSPEAAGTPVLSIRTLLDSSRSSLLSRGSGERGGRKRTTVGVASETRRRREGRTRGSLGAAVTPRSAVGPVPEAVKNKHSSAKRPQSKRSMIDDLDRSDIVKQLFNSPLKRKLSRSMTEFSRNRLFEDDDDDATSAARPTRNTVAAFAVTPDDSLPELSEDFTPERFVSPVGTPDDSPNSTGIERSFERYTPEIESRDVEGAEGSPRTPRTRRSPRNPGGDVGRKGAGAATPGHLRRGAAAKALRAKGSPKNDLSDFRGVKRLFERGSPLDDLRDVSGVRRILRNASPRNDLTDVRGVRRAFRRRRPSDDRLHLSGIGRLFDVSDGSEAPFDATVGRPPVRSVHSRTLSTRTPREPKPRKAKSLPGSADATADKVEEWLARELRRRFRAAGERALPLKKRAVVHSTPVKGRPRAAAAAAAAGLARVSPIRAPDLSLARSIRPATDESSIASTDARTARGRKTPEKIDGETPPKRSTRTGTRANLSRTNTKLRRSSVVIRKRAPVPSPRPRRGLATRADTAPKTETPKRTRTRESRAIVVVTKTSPKFKPLSDKKPKAVERNGTRGAAVAETKPASPRNRPRRTRAGESRTAARSERVAGEDPAPPRTRRKVGETEDPAPPRTRRKVGETEDPAPPRTRRKVGETEDPAPPRTRRKVGETEDPAPPRTRRKVGETEDPAPPRTRCKVGETEDPAPPRTRRKVGETEDPAPPEMRRNNRTRPSIVVETTVKTRSRSVVLIKGSSEKKQTGTRGRKIDTVASVESEPVSRGRGGRKPVKEITQNETRGKRDLNSETEVAVGVKSSRGKKAETQSSVRSEPATRSRRNKTLETVVTKERKRKAADVEEIPPKVAKTEPKRHKKEAPAPETRKPIRGAAKENKYSNSDDEPSKPTRAARNKLNVAIKKSPVKKEAAKPIEKEVKTTRGRKAAEPKEVAVTTRGKRKANAEASPVKVTTQAVGRTRRR